jgi:hypothetical protein
MSTKLGKLIDQAQRLRIKKDAMVGVIDEQIAAVKAEIEAEMRADKLTSANGVDARASFRTVATADAVDWSALYKFIEKHRAYDLLQKRLSVGAARERIAAGEKVPGIELGERTELVIAALKKE